MTVQSYLEQLLQHLAIEDAKVVITEEDETFAIDIQVQEDDAGLLIGGRGDTLQALRQIVTATFREELMEKRVHVNINDYRQKKEEAAHQIGIEAAERALAEGRPQYLPRSLRPYQRRIIHQALEEYQGVYSESEGDGENRILVVYPEDYQR